MSAAASVRVGRFYTSARRHPWVLGKVADWKIPLGPYTPAQITVAVGGGFLLVKTISWWSQLGPIPIAAWLLAIWAVRRPKIRGRSPMQAALGWMLLVWQPRGGRIGGHAARDRAPHPLLGSYTIENPTPTTPTAPAGGCPVRVPIVGSSEGGTETRCQTLRETLARRQSLSGSPRGHNKGLTTQATFGTSKRQGL